MLIISFIILYQWILRVKTSTDSIKTHSSGKENETVSFNIFLEISQSYTREKITCKQLFFKLCLFSKSLTFILCNVIKKFVHCEKLVQI